MADVISEQDFEREATLFLEAHAPRRVEISAGWGEGSDEVSILPEKNASQELAELESARTWARARYDAGFGWITGPEEFGGRALPRNYQRIFDGVEARFDTPLMSVYGIGLGMVAPTILAHATEPVRKKYLPQMYRGDIVGCQLFSERAQAAISLRFRRERHVTATNGS